MSDSCSPSQALWECFKVRKGNLWHCDEYFASVWMSLRMMTSVPWIQSAWGEVLSAHRRSCHRGGKPEESWEKMIVRDNFCTSLHPRSPKIGLSHLSIRAPGSRLSSTNPALKSGDDCHWAKRIFQWSLCDVPSQSWMPILSSSSWSLTSYKEW